MNRNYSNTEKRILITKSLDSTKSNKSLRQRNKFLIEIINRFWNDLISIINEK